jgi:hypothetical protein
MASIIGVNELQHSNGTTAATIDSSGNVTFSGTTNAGPSDSDWITPTLNSGYASLSSPYGPVQYRKIGNIVNIIGLVTGSATGVVFTLPEGYRPPTNVVALSNSSNGVGRVDVTTAGNVEIGVTNNSGSWISLYHTFMTA